MAGKTISLGRQIGTDKVGPKPGLTKTFHEKHVLDKKVHTRNRAQEMQMSPYVIDPRKSKLVGKWDMLMVVALLFTAVVTPVEVSFLDEGQYITPLCTLVI